MSESSSLIGPVFCFDPSDQAAEQLLSCMLLTPDSAFATFAKSKTGQPVFMVGNGTAICRWSEGVLTREEVPVGVCDSHSDMKVQRRTLNHPSLDLSIKLWSSLFPESQAFRKLLVSEHFHSQLDSMRRTGFDTDLRPGFFASDPKTRPVLCQLDPRRPDADSISSCRESALTEKARASRATWVFLQHLSKSFRGSAER